MSEYLYALINPTMPGLIKVGKTTRDPEDRANELSSVTSVPTRFILVHSEVVNDCTAAEVWVHEQLEMNNYRVAQNREFFNAPLHVVIDFIRASKSIGNSAGGLGVISESSPITSANLIEELLDSAEEAMEGTHETFSNPREGEKLLRQAAQLGSTEAYSRLGQIYSFGAQGIQEDREKALVHFKAAFETGSWRAGGDIGLILLRHGKDFAATAYLKNFFQTCYDKLINPQREDTNGIEALLMSGASALKRYFYVKYAEKAMEEIGKNFLSEIETPNHVIAPFVNHALTEEDLVLDSGEGLPIKLAMNDALKALQSEVGPWDISAAVLAREQIMNAYTVGSIVNGTVIKRSWSWIQISVDGIPATVMGCDVALEQPDDSRRLFSIGDEIEVVLTKKQVRDFSFYASRKAALQRQISSAE